MVERHEGSARLETDLLVLPGVVPTRPRRWLPSPSGTELWWWTPISSSSPARAVTGVAQAAPFVDRRRVTPARPVFPRSGDLGCLERRHHGVRCTRLARRGGRGVLPLNRRVRGGWKPADRHTRGQRRGQGYEGTDRKVRGDILQRLRDAPTPLPRQEFDDIDPAEGRIDRLLHALITRASSSRCQQ